jgi:hypothetical protein
MRLVFAFLAAIFVPACLITGGYLHDQFARFESDDPFIWVRTRGFLVLCLSNAAAHVVVLGIPAYLVLRKLNAVRWWSGQIVPAIMAPQGPRRTRSKSREDLEAEDTLREYRHRGPRWPLEPNRV